MNINKNNYEAFFLDYHEGNLAPQQVADLFLFVEQHPELQETFESFENLTLEDFSSVKFEDKASLKKEITLENKEEHFIRAIENTLNTDEKGLLDNFLKQYPQFLFEFELFQKTKLSPDTSIVFENKNEFKKSFSSIKLDSFEKDELFISAVEDLLTKEETTIFNQQLLDDTQIKKEYALFQQTKLVADTSTVFHEKEKLKHRNKKVVPFFYYISAAASIILLFGLFFLFNNANIKPKLAYNENRMEIQSIKSIESPVSSEKKVEENIVQSIGIANFAVKKETPKKENIILKDSLDIAPKEVLNQSIAFEKENNKSVVINKDSIVTVSSDFKQIKDNSNVIVQTEKKIETATAIEFISFPELAVEKIKEKLLDKNTIAAQKKSQRWKKISGWDIAQIITRGISKFTGRKVEVNPYYNDEGNVIAYAVSAGGFQLSKGR